MKRKYTKYTKEILQPIVKSSTSYAQCLNKLGLVIAGGNYSLLQRNIDKFEIDTSHMTHNAHNRGKDLKPFHGLTGKSAIKRRVIKEDGYKCNKCGISEWNGLPIMLELEHINGDNRDNSRGNLELLCPNCHSQTLTWRNRKRK